MSKKTKMFHYLVTTRKYSEEKLRQGIEDSFTTNGIAINIDKKISVDTSELQKKPFAFEESFIQHSTHISEIIAMLYSITFGSNLTANYITIYYICKENKEYLELSVNLRRFRFPDDASFQLRTSYEEAKKIIVNLKNDIGKKALGKIEREIAVFVNYYIASNTSEIDSPIERFLSFWSSFNALYTCFADKHIKPMVSAFKQNTTLNIGVDFGDRDEIFFVEQFLDIDVIETIYLLRNDIIHGNTPSPLIYSINENYSNMISRISDATIILKECLNISYTLCFDNKPKFSRLLGIVKHWIEKKIDAMNKSDGEKEELHTQLNTRYQELVNQTTE